MEAFDDVVWRESERNRSRKKVIVATTIGGLSAAAIGLGVLCCIFLSWRERRREGRPARERERRDRKERQDAIE